MLTSVDGRKFQPQYPPRKHCPGFRTFKNSPKKACCLLATKEKSSAVFMPKSPTGPKPTNSSPANTALVGKSLDNLFYESNLSTNIYGKNGNHCGRSRNAGSCGIQSSHRPA